MGGNNSRLNPRLFGPSTTSLVTVGDLVIGPVDSAPSYSTTWFVNSATGSDRATGTSSGAPLATLAELSRRLRGVVFRANMTVTLSGTFAEDLVITWTAVNGCSVAIVGTPVQILTGTFTAKTDIAAGSATNADVTDSAIPTSWTASGAVDHTATRGSYLIRKMSGASTVAGAFTCKDMGAKVCRVSSWVSTTEDPFQSTSTQLETTVTVGNAYRVDSLTQIGDVIVCVAGTNVILQWVDIRAIGATPLKLANAGTSRITLRMAIVGSDSLVEGGAALNWYCACFQFGSSGLMIGECNGFGLLLRGPSAASVTWRIFGSGGFGIPGTTVLQSCGIYMENGTAVGITNLLANDLTAGVPAVELRTNSRCSFATIAGVSCADVGIQTGAGSVAVLSSGVVGTFTAGSSRVCGTIIPNAKLGAASYDYAHQSGVVLANGIGTVGVGPAGNSTTAARPTVGLAPGMLWFDTTLNKPIWRNAANNAWLDATGAGV